MYLFIIKIIRLIQLKLYLKNNIHYLQITE